MSTRPRAISIMVAAALAVAGWRAVGQERMPPLAADDLTEQQAQALTDFVATRGQPSGPWIALLRSPELMTHARTLGNYLDYQNALPGYLRELVILLTAR